LDDSNQTATQFSPQSPLERSIFAKLFNYLPSVLTDIIARVIVVAIAAVVDVVVIDIIVVDIVVVHMHVTVFFRMTVQIRQAGWEAHEVLLTVIVVQIIRLHMLR
jgi:heme/copper-type cytochrome/quinol oxidase subunit 4